MPVYATRTLRCGCDLSGLRAHARAHGSLVVRARAFATFSSLPFSYALPRCTPYTRSFAHVCTFALRTRISQFCAVALRLRITRRFCTHDHPPRISRFISLVAAVGCGYRLISSLPGCVCLCTRAVHIISYHIYHSWFTLSCRISGRVWLLLHTRLLHTLCLRLRISFSLRTAVRARVARVHRTPLSFCCYVYGYVGAHARLPRTFICTFTFPFADLRAHAFTRLRICHVDFTFAVCTFTLPARILHLDFTVCPRCGCRTHTHAAFACTRLRVCTHVAHACPDLRFARLLYALRLPLDCVAVCCPRCRCLRCTLVAADLCSRTTPRLHCVRGSLTRVATARLFAAFAHLRLPFTRYTPRTRTHAVATPRLPVTLRLPLRGSCRLRSAFMRLLRAFCCCVRTLGSSHLVAAHAVADLFVGCCGGFARVARYTHRALRLPLHVPRCTPRMDCWFGFYALRTGCFVRGYAFVTRCTDLVTRFMRTTFTATHYGCAFACGCCHIYHVLSFVTQLRALHTRIYTHTADYAPVTFARFVGFTPFIYVACTGYLGCFADLHTRVPRLRGSLVVTLRLRYVARSSRCRTVVAGSRCWLRVLLRARLCLLFTRTLRCAHVLRLDYHTRTTRILPPYVRFTPRLHGLLHATALRIAVLRTLRVYRLLPAFVNTLRFAC